MRVTGGEAVVRSLIAEGVDTLFGLPGIQNDWLYNALYDARDRIRVIHTRHEQGAAYMALGYALATGGIGVYNVVPGPGFLNTTAALSTAYALNARVLCLAGQIPLAAIGRDGGVLHEIPDQLGVMRSLTKWAARVTTVAEIPTLMADAFGALRSKCPWTSSRLRVRSARSTLRDRPHQSPWTMRNSKRLRASSERQSGRSSGSGAAPTARARRFARWPNTSRRPSRPIAPAEA
jgi:hypothetical protein